MKKIITLIVTSALFVSNVAAQKLYIKKNNGTYEAVSGNLYFSQNGTSDQWSFSTVEGGVYRSTNDISNASGVAIVSGKELELASYKAPTYLDNYTSIAGWSQRTQWNLSNIHDPSVVKAADGYYYMYQTDASYGNAHNEDTADGKYGHFYCRRSQNLVDWEFMGATMYGLPSWVKTKLNEIRTAMGLGESAIDFSQELDFGYWAPCVRKVNDNLYRMYYCITCPGNIDGSDSWGERAFIGLMETTDPADLSKWEDKGFVITNFSDKELNFNVSPTAWESCYFKYNAIDPTFIITPEGQHWLIYGSWHSGFAAVELDAATGKTKTELGNPWGTENEAAYGKRIFTRNAASRWQGSEAPEVVYHDGYYYLFVAYDALDVPYNTRVLRSKNVDGPYVTMNGEVTDAANGAGDHPTVLTHPYKFSEGYGWVGISHCAVFDDGNGNWYYCSQQRYPADVTGINASNAIMMGGVRSIKWLSNGWPVVMPERYGAVPEYEISESDIIGTWEHIDLGYSKGNQKTAGEMVFGADHKITSGIWTGGSWSFDPSTNTLTANGVELKVQREVDWEASPRKATIVYSGLNGSKAYWGKKMAGLSESEDNVTIVGSTDCTTGWWSAFSDYYTIPAGKTLHVKLKNHSSMNENYHNWLIVLTTDADRATTEYVEYFVLRADNWAWWPDGNTGSNPERGFTLTSNYYWDTFKSDMNDANVDITVTRDGATITVTAVTTTQTGTVYTETFIMPNCGDGNQTVRAFLTCEQSWLEIYNSETYVE